MKDMLLLLLGFVLLNNVALTGFLGLQPLLGFSGRREKILALGLSVTGVTLLVSVLLWLLRGLLPEALTVLFAVALTLALVYLLQLVCGRKLGLFFPVIALNGAVLGLALRTLAAENLLSVVLSALGAGLGFLLGLFLLEGVQSRIEQDRLPKAFRGFPSLILAAAIVALALTGFDFQ
ncbi:MAG: hypothetical protein K6G17_07515 [Oscillospiraceae bacterium]|nr:hypothetical protein [Oscillospiraceae bacterium]